jgi:hypothetical protein
LARHIAGTTTGPASFENPVGWPRLRSTMRVEPAEAASQVYVVSIGKGPSVVRMTSRRPGTSSTTS